MLFYNSGQSVSNITELFGRIVGSLKFYRTFGPLFVFVKIPIGPITNFIVSIIAVGTT